MREKGSISYLNIIFLLIMMFSIISLCLVKTINIIHTSKDIKNLKIQMEMETANFNMMECTFNDTTYNNDSTIDDFSTTSKFLDDDLYLVTTTYNSQETYTISYYFRKIDSGYYLEMKTVSVTSYDN